MSSTQVPRYRLPTSTRVFLALTVVAILSVMWAPRRVQWETLLYGDPGISGTVACAIVDVVQG